MSWADRIAAINVTVAGRPVALHLFDNPLCRDVTRSILEGKTYPCIEFVKNPKVVMDVGANIGAASVYFALQYPQANVYAFEPFPAAFDLLKRNTSSIANVRTFDVGLLDQDCQLPLYLSKEDAVTNSVGTSYLNGQSSVQGRFRSAGEFCREVGIETVDVLKVDTEGCELAILRSLAGVWEKSSVIYLEYHDEADRIAVDDMLKRTHILIGAKVRHAHRGELCYVGYHAFPSAPALERLRIKSMACAAPPTDSVASTQAFDHSRPTKPAAQYQVTVVLPTILRPSLLRAAESVFAQKIDGRGQLLIGIDQAVGERRVLNEVQSLRPSNWDVVLFDLGYSTSVRHGGLHRATDGGALRTILSYAAHSRYVAYLDDDNWWSVDHLPSLLAAIPGRDWAFSQRWFVDGRSLQPLCVDSWESVGPGRGVYNQKLGGFIDPNTLMIDKIACEAVLRWWSVPLSRDPKGMSADRHVFDVLRQQYRGVSTNNPTCFYCIDVDDPEHSLRGAKVRQAVSEQL